MREKQERETLEKENPRTAIRRHPQPPNQIQQSSPTTNDSRIQICPKYKETDDSQNRKPSRAGPRNRHRFGVKYAKRAQIRSKIKVVLGWISLFLVIRHGLLQRAHEIGKRKLSPNNGRCYKSTEVMNFEVKSKHMFRIGRFQYFGWWCRWRWPSPLGGATCQGTKIQFRDPPRSPLTKSRCVRWIYDLEGVGRGWHWRRRGWWFEGLSSPLSSWHPFSALSESWWKDEFFGCIYMGECRYPFLGRSLVGRSPINVHKMNMNP